MALLCGVAVMGVEMAAGRLIAPWYGTSTVVWSLLIATVLGSMALGAVWGGRLADRPTRLRSLGVVLCAAGLLVTALPWLAPSLLSGSMAAFGKAQISGLIAGLLAMLAAIAGPVTLASAVTPILIAEGVSAGLGVGQVAGRVGAMGTLGSLMGTLLAGIVAVPLVGAALTLGVCGGLLLLAGLVAWRSWTRRAAPQDGRAATKTGQTPATAVAPTLLLLLLPLGPVGVQLLLPEPALAQGTLVARVDSPYQSIRVVERGAWRKLIVDEGFAVQSVRRLDGGLPLVSVWSWYALAPAWTDAGCPSTALLIGLGGGTSAHVLTQLCPQTQITGVELDAAIVQLGRRYFDLPGSVEVVIGDGRVFLQRDTRRFDLILVDAYRFPYLPFQLVTREAFAAYAAHLQPGGAVVINVAQPSRRDRLLPAILRTAADVFPHLAVAPKAAHANALLVARQRPFSLAAGLPRLAYPPAVRGRLARLAPLQAAVIDQAAWLLRDDRAPVEWLTDWAIVARLMGARP